MRQIELHGKHAIGEHRFTVVDDEDYAELSQYRWKAKPNGDGKIVYAIRVAQIDGKTVDIRMHREVLGLVRGDPRDVDHINHDSLDNRRANLRACTRSINVANSRTVAIECCCAWCGTTALLVRKSVNATRVKYCGADCRQKAFAARAVERDRARPFTERQATSCKVSFGKCLECAQLFTARKCHQKFCCVRCKDNYKSRGRPPDEHVIKQCQWCEVEYVREHNNQRYCSSACTTEAENARRRQARTTRPLGPWPALG